MIKRKLMMGGVALFLVLAACGQRDAAEEPAEPASPIPTAPLIERLRTANDVPGASYAALEACKVSEVYASGLAVVEAEETATPTTLFEAASLSKPVFAYLVMALAEEGLLDLDRPLAETFDYPRLADQEQYAALTPRMVLTHRTGLPNWMGEGDFYQREGQVTFTEEPGAAFTYSGEGFQLLQAFTEDLTGKSLEEQFQERLGALMPNSTFRRPFPEGAVLSRGYARASEPETGRDMVAVGERGMAASSLATTAEDYAQFLSHVCRRTGLKPQTYAEYLRPQSPAPEEGPFPTSWALGFMTVEVDGATFIGHGGNNGNYRALAGFIKETGDGFVVLTNSQSGQSMIDALADPSTE